MLRLSYIGAATGLCFVLGVAIVATMPDMRPAQQIEDINLKGKLYLTPWGNKVVALAKSCEDLNAEQCATLRYLVKEVPHAFWIDNVTKLSEDMSVMLDVLIDAQKNGQIPTLVMYSLPDRDCGGERRLNKVFDRKDYIFWANQIATAIGAYDFPINVIIEPHALEENVTNKLMPCGDRTKSEVLLERIALLRRVIWELAERIDGTKKRAHPKIRVYLDIGGPERITDARGRLALVNAIDWVLQKAEIDGVSVNVGEHASFEESLAWAKKIIKLMDPGNHRNLKVAIDIGRSGRHADGSCNAQGAALDVQHLGDVRRDSIVGLATIIWDPSVSDGRSEACHHGPAAGEFHLELFKDYLTETARALALTQ
jgi:endoglucanase